MEEATNRRILNGWKQISNHIDRGVRTAQRWEVLLGMPVHRPALKDRSAVVAFSDELECWLCRSSAGAGNEPVAADHPATDINPMSNERLLFVLDKMSTLVQQSCDFLSQMQLLQEQVRRSRKPERLASRARVRAASAPRRVVSWMQSFPRRKHRLPIGRTVLAGMVDAPGGR